MTASDWGYDSQKMQQMPGRQQVTHWSVQHLRVVGGVATDVRSGTTELHAGASSGV